MNKPMILLTMLLAFGAAFAQRAIDPDDCSIYGSGGYSCDAAPSQCKTVCALSGVKGLLCQVLPIVIMLAIVIAAILYAVGQLGSAESRAKFHGWATNIVIGAITALIVILIVPWLLAGLMPGGKDLLDCAGGTIAGATSK